MILFDTNNKKVAICLSLSQVNGPIVLKVGPFENNRRFDDLLYYRSFIGDKIPEQIYINLPINGDKVYLVVNGNAVINDVYLCPIVINESIYNIELPPAERYTDQNKIDKLNIVIKNDLEFTPARTIPQLGYIEIASRIYKEYPQQWRYFILLHELGHTMYKTEWKCDLFAFVNFIQQGYNESQAIYALTRVLHRSAKSLERIERLLNSANYVQSNYIPFSGTII